MDTKARIALQAEEGYGIALGETEHYNIALDHSGDAACRIALEIVEVITPVVLNNILLEDGSALLLEDGTSIYLEQAV